MQTTRGQLTVIITIIIILDIYLHSPPLCEGAQGVTKAWGEVVVVVELYYNYMKSIRNCRKNQNAQSEYIVHEKSIGQQLKGGVG